MKKEEKEALRVKTLEEIKNFRKVHLKSCVSTSSLMKFNTFILIVKDLKRIYKNFDVTIDKDKVTVKIRCFKRRV